MKQIPFREQLIWVVGALASQRGQIEYEKNVSIAYVPDELVCQFFGCVHFKFEGFIAEFTADELKEIAILSGYVSMASDEVLVHKNPQVLDVLKLPKWREMMSRAKRVLEILER